MKGKLINFRGSAELAEAIRIVAFNEGHSNNSRTITRALLADPAIRKEYNKLQRSVKNKVSAN